MTAKDKKTNALLPLFVGGGIALLGIVMVQSYVSREKQAYKQSMQREEIHVLIVDRPIEQGSPIPADNLKHKRVIKEQQPWSTIKFDDPESGSEAKRYFDNLVASIAGHTVNRTIDSGSMVLWTDLKRTPELTLGEILKDEQRAVAVIVDASSVLDGLLLPNDRVDVLATYEARIASVSGAAAAASAQGTPEEKTVVVMEDVVVLAVGNSLAGGGMRGGDVARGTRVVLGLSPDDALALSHVQKIARISLLMRPRNAVSPGDYSQSVIAGGDVQTLVRQLGQ